MLLIMITSNSWTNFLPLFEAAQYVDIVFIITITISGHEVYPMSHKLSHVETNWLGLIIFITSYQTELLSCMKMSPYQLHVAESWPTVLYAVYLSINPFLLDNNCKRNYVYVYSYFSLVFA